MKTRLALATLLALALLAAGAGAALAEGDLESRISRLEDDVRRQGAAVRDQGMEMEEYGGFVGLPLLLLFATTFAIWAQNRDRSALGWFLCGLLPGLNIVAAFVLLHLNSEHNRAARSGAS